MDGHFCGDKRQDDAEIRQKEVAQVRRNAEGHKLPEIFKFEPPRGSFNRSRVRPGKEEPQIPLLVFEGSFKNALEQFFVAVEQSLVDGGLGIHLFKNRVLVVSGRNVAKGRDANQACKVA